MKEQSSQREPFNESAFLKKYRAKAFFIKGLISGSEPATIEGELIVKNARQMASNSDEIRGKGSAVRNTLERFMLSTQIPDRFSIQRYSAEFVSALLQGTEKLDMVDLILAVRASNSIMADVLGEHPTPAQFDRFSTLQNAYFREFAQAVDPFKIVDADILNTAFVYKDIFYQGENLSPNAQNDAMTLQRIITDRLIIHHDLVLEGGLWTKQDGSHGESSYSHPPKSPRELESLNAAAADTIEGLHLLKAYGVAPFEVSGERIGLPWDIAVFPPLEKIEDREHRYADGAVADFILLKPDSNRSDILMRYSQDDEQNATFVSVGDSNGAMRFRLHDNGQISHGLLYHNIPSDLTEHVFAEAYSTIAFQRLRGLFIALAFDALVPDDVVTGKDVQGSVASTLGERQSPTAQDITDLLLRRRKALQRARVNESQRFPEGWDGPRKEVGGYIRKLPEGTRARPTAEQEASKYYNSIGVAFDGLPEGYNFVGAYDKRALLHVTYRRALFRNNSSTAEYLRSLKF